MVTVPLLSEAEAADALPELVLDAVAEAVPELHPASMIMDKTEHGSFQKYII